MNLDSVDGRLLDGLHFCHKVYSLFDQIRRARDGVARLRLRPTKMEKRLLEELLPLARYVQARYKEGRRIKVRWFAGSQPYDAVLLSSGGLVEHGVAPRKVIVEITTSVHQNEYLMRQLLQERGGSFGVKGISRDKRTGEIVSTPHIHSPDGIVGDLVEQVLERIDKKSRKCSFGTVLIVNCVTDGLTDANEWDEAVKRIRNAEKHLLFSEVFLINFVMSHSERYSGMHRCVRRMAYRNP